jgi:hypothetical protein
MHGIEINTYLQTQGKRVFIKDIIHYLVPPSGKPASLAPSLLKVKRGIGTNGEVNGNDHGHVDGVNGVTTNGEASAVSLERSPPYPYGTQMEPGNPTVVPVDLLSQFHFTFLIRDPHYSIPSYYRCTIPPLDAVTGFYDFYPSEAGYDEVRRVFEYLREVGLVGPRVAAVEGDTNGVNGAARRKDGVEICVIDADELLDHPAVLIERYCKSVGIAYDPAMLNWDNEEDQAVAKAAFEKWKGFHNDAIDSQYLKARDHVSLLFFSFLFFPPPLPTPTDMASCERRRNSNPRRNSTPNGARSTA